MCTFQYARVFGIQTQLCTAKYITSLESSLNFVLRFVKRHLHGGPPDVVDTDALQQRVRELEEQNKKLESELALVKQQVIL